MACRSPFHSHNPLAPHCAELAAFVLQGYFVPFCPETQWYAKEEPHAALLSARTIWNADEGRRVKPKRLAPSRQVDGTVNTLIEELDTQRAARPNLSRSCNPGGGRGEVLF